MAFGKTTTYTAAIQGIPGVGAGIDELYKVDAIGSPKFSVGHLLEASDGKRYRYCHFGAAASQGKLVGPDVIETDEIVNRLLIVAPASAQTTTDGTINSFYIEATTAGVSVDEYAGAYLITSDNTGEGYTYQIESNTETGDPASGNIRIKLKTKLAVAVAATTDVSIVGSKYSNCKTVSITANRQRPTGVVVGNVDAANKFGWVCTRGIQGTLVNGVILRGESVVASTTTTGAVDASPLAGVGLNDVKIVGWVAQTAASTAYAGIELGLE